MGFFHLKHRKTGVFEYKVTWFFIFLDKKNSLYGTETLVKEHGSLFDFNTVLVTNFNIILNGDIVFDDVN